MGIDNKYGRVTTERGDIGTDEPVIVFRSQDAMLPAVLDYYRQVCFQAGSPDAHLNLIEDTKTKVLEWQRANSTKVPESLGYKES